MKNQILSRAVLAAALAAPLLVITTSSSAASVFAQETRHGGHETAVAQAPADVGDKSGVAGQMVDGEVKKIDKEAGKITIRHAELKNLGMPAMTMVFRAKDAVMLDQVQAGDKVKFVAEKLNGAMVVVQLQRVK
jgi:Cu(I)/Ag(I) efflux system protein CusF